jgi:PAS domain S-box-containing protein
MSREQETVPGAQRDVRKADATLADAARLAEPGGTLAPKLVEASRLMALCVLIGGTAILLIGWGLGITAFTSLVPGQVTTKPNTAICFMLSAGALLLLRGSSGRRRGLAFASAALALAIATLSLAEYVFGWDAGIDQLLIHDTMSQVATSDAGRMAPNTAVALILLTGAILVWDLGIRRVRVTNVLAFIGGLIAFMALLGYVTETTSLAGISGSTRMALPTSILLIALAMGIALARPDQGLAAMVASPGPGGHALRRALPVAVVVPLVLAWIRWRLQATGVVGTQVGIWISASLVVGLSVWLIVAISSSLERADTRRRRAERDLRTLIELAPDAIVVVDGAGAITRANAQAGALLGYRREELIGMPVEVVVPKELREAHRSHRRGFTLEPRPRSMGQDLELHAMRKDGGRVPVEISLSPVTLDGHRHVIAAIRDVSDRVQADEALRLAEERFRNAFDEAPIGMALVAPDGRWLRVNRSICEIVGYSEQELLGLTFQDITHPADLDADLEYVRQMLAGEIRTYRMEKRYFHKDGHIVWINLSVSLVRDSAGTPVHFVGQIEDITERREAEVARARAERARDEFFALVSHELRTPLTSIMVSADLIADGEDERLTEAGRSYVEVIQRNAEREMRLVSDLLLLVQIQEGTFEVHLEQANLREIVEDAVEAARPVAERREVAVSSHTVPTLPCRGDNQRLGQALDNLLANAIKFTPPGGNVDVRLSVEDGTAAIEVQDTGIGIPEEERNRLFERLFRGADARTAEVPGLGLGLTIVRTIVNAHGGQVEVDSMVGVGTTFRLVLPVGAPTRMNPVVR